MKVYVNMDGVCSEDKEYWAEMGGVHPDGIGLFRTEHSTSINEIPNFYMRLFIGLKFNIDTILPPMISHFKNLLEKDIRASQELAGCSEVVVRLLDPPMGEFMNAGDIDPVAEEVWQSHVDAGGENLWWCRGPEGIKQWCRQQTRNSMMGLRGIRLCMAQTRILAPQLSAIHAVKGTKILLPMIGYPWEVSHFMQYYLNWCKNCFYEPREVGVMLETPAACLYAGDISRLCSFVSFGTNDLQQFTYGVDRDSSDLWHVLCEGYRQQLNDELPEMGQATWDLIKIAVSHVRVFNPKCVIGCCGDSASNPGYTSSYKELGLDYLSVPACSVKVIQDAVQGIYS